MHAEQIAVHGGSSGLRDAGLLSSALARPRHLLAFRPDSTIFELAVAYCYGISKINHPFVDENKRTGTVVCETFLRINGYDLVCENDEWCEILLDVASGNINESEFANWVAVRVIPRDA